MAEPFKDPSKIAYANDAPKLKFNISALIPSLIRTSLESVTGLPSPAATAEWAKVLSFKEGKERQAFNLVANSLINACYTQMRHRICQVDIDESENLVFAGQELRFQVFDALVENEYVFDCHHRTNPQVFPLLRDFTPYYNQWLGEAFRLPETQAGDLARDFPDYFAYELYQLLLKKQSDYQDLINWCDSPYNEALETNLARLCYKAKLRNRYHQPALGEQAVSLSDVYVQPSFLVYERMLEDETLKALRADDKNVRQEHFISCGFEGTIHDYLRQYFLTDANYKGIKEEVGNSRLMVLLGHPGHGKSSFCYRSIFDLLQADDNGSNAFFVRLQSFDDKALSEPIDEVINQLPKDLKFKAWIDEKQGQKSLLFLDGLDEFCMTQSLTDAQVIGFIQKCKKLTEHNPLLHIIITSRFNYVETAKLHDHDCQLLSLGKLNLAQQHDLVTRFMGKMADKTCHLSLPMLERINKEEQYKHVRELIELPILLQMVLIAQVDVEAAGSRAAIYDQLFTQVLSRKWDKEGKLKKYTKDTGKFNEKHLRKYLAFLAFKIFQSKRGYLNKSDIGGYPETEVFSKKLKLVNEGMDMKSVLKDILTSFYLNETRKDGSDRLQSDKDNEYAIEFLHKSLYEYLACEYIWVAVKEYFLEKEADGDGYKTRTTEEVQQRMQKLFANVRLTKETLEYLKEIIARDTNPHKDLAEEMSGHFAKLLKHGFLYEYKANPAEIPLYRPEQMVLNIFHVYWAILGSLRLHEVEVGRFMETEWEELVKRELNEENIEAMIQAYQFEIEKINEREWDDFYSSIVKNVKTEFSSWATELLKVNKSDNMPKYINPVVWVRQRLLLKHGLKVMELQIKALKDNLEQFTNHMLMATIERVDISLNLQYIDLKAINLSNIFAKNINLTGANLMLANLKGANLSSANIEYAYLNRANLFQANLEGANLKFANLGRANLRQANLGFVDLNSANLWRANLENANLVKAILNNANFHFANFHGADLRRANLSNANFLGANLKHAILDGAVVDSLNWLLNLSSIEVEGASELQRKYIVVVAKSFTINSFGKKWWQGYRLKERESMVEEDEVERDF